jgi:hypothetical protein
MRSGQCKDLNDLPSKAEQVTIQLPERQARVLKNYCAQHGLSADNVVLAALCAMIEGFDQA